LSTFDHTYINEPDFAIVFAHQSNFIRLQVALASAVGSMGLLISISCIALLHGSVIYAVFQSIKISVGEVKNGHVSHIQAAILQACVGKRGFVIFTTSRAALLQTI